jgi:hypothetical protein
LSLQLKKPPNGIRKHTTILCKHFHFTPQFLSLNTIHPIFSLWYYIPQLVNLSCLCRSTAGVTKDYKRYNCENTLYTLKQEVNIKRWHGSCSYNYDYYHSNTATLLPLYYYYWSTNPRWGYGHNSKDLRQRWASQI